MTNPRRSRWLYLIVLACGAIVAALILVPLRASTAVPQDVERAYALIEVGMRLPDLDGEVKEHYEKRFGYSEEEMTMIRADGPAPIDPGWRASFSWDDYVIFVYYDPKSHTIIQKRIYRIGSSRIWESIVN
jgi:hypothetical protein